MTTLANDPKPQRTKASKKPSQRYVNHAGELVSLQGIEKFYRDIIVYQNGTNFHGKMPVTLYAGQTDAYAGVLTASPQSPICQKCKLLDKSAQHPFFDYLGPDDPLVTIIVDSISPKADDEGYFLSWGAAAQIAKIIKQTYDQHGVGLHEIRFVSMTRCANRQKAVVNVKGAGGWCRYFAIEDLIKHPPKLVMPVGTTALGLLSYKSNAGDWGGKLLTWRGWPDDWLTNKKYVLPRRDPEDWQAWKLHTKDPANPPGKEITGHPLFGPIPQTRIPMMPIQAPRLVYMMQNLNVTNRWTKQIVRALTLARSGVPAKSYTRPWYLVTEDVDEIERILTGLLACPEILLTYDTETTGLKPLAPGAAIVFMMFRWTDPKTWEPRSLGFPWDFPESGVQPHIDRLSPLILQVLRQSTLLGHNLTFDVLYTHFNVKDPTLAGLKGRALLRAQDDCLVALANVAKKDTWHMRYILRQERGSLGLENLVYQYCPDLAGYEEDMTLLIELHREEMHPAEGKGGHYANCPRDKWDSHLIPYVMGDVEGCYGSYRKIAKKLEHTEVYRFPLAHATERNKFRLFRPPDRGWVYKNIMSPASRVLIKLMGRGMFVDQDKLTELELKMPEEVKDRIRDLGNADPVISAWCKKTKEANPEWEFDIEEKATLKAILFEELKLPIQRLTKNGRKLYGEDPEKWRGYMAQVLQVADPTLTGAPLKEAVNRELLSYAALDKFTLNKLAVDHPQVRPLQKYRKVYKLYNTYVRPLRNVFDPAIDTKPRTKEAHLCRDSCVHAQFRSTGTRSGRLSSADPNFQNFPRKGDVKSLYTSRFGRKEGCLLSSDLSQIELRLLAAACGDPTMVQAYFDGTDLHSLTASRIFKRPYEQFTKQHFEWLQKKGRNEEVKDLEQKRTISKTSNFLTGYGGGAFGLQNVLANSEIYMPIEECEYIISAFFDSYPALQEHIQFYKRFIRDHGVACSLFGRIRVFEEVFGEDKEFVSKALRAGYNHMIQSTASDMMLVALVVIEQLMRESNLESMLVSTVHDSLLIDALRTELPAIYEINSMVLNNFPAVFRECFGESYDTSWMIVPFAGDSEVGLDYNSMAKVSGKNPDWDKLLAQ